jgi:hypothetical protein
MGDIFAARSQMAMSCLQLWPTSERDRVRTEGACYQPPRLAGHQGSRDEPGVRKPGVSAAVIAGGPVNIVTGSHLDPDTNTPAYKETAVRVELLPEQSTNPLRPLNFRFSGKPTPQTGVEMERKWKRKVYHMPGTEKLVQIQSHKGASPYDDSC